MLIGVISDTHGLLRPEAVEALRGAERIIHAGDIGAPDVLAALAQLAPVTAVRGNNDKGAWAHAVPATAVLEAGAVVVLQHASKAPPPDAVGVLRVVRAKKFGETTLTFFHAAL